MQQQQLQEEEPDPALTQSLKALSSKRAEVRQEAEQQFEQMGERAIEQLLAVLRREARKRKVRRRNIIIGIACYVVFVMVLAIFTHSAQMFNMIGSMTGVLSAAFAASQTQKSAAKALAKFHDIRTVGPLSEALEFNDKDVISVAKSSLMTLLPELQASDSRLLNEEQRACLCRALNGKDIELSQKILKAFQQVGDSKALPIVQKLAAGEGRAAKNPTLRESAQECLLFLGPRVEQEIASQQLLRASDSSAEAQEILLRPSMETGETAPEQLLRASQPETPPKTPVQSLFQ